MNHDTHARSLSLRSARQDIRDYWIFYKLMLARSKRK